VDKTITCSPPEIYIQLYEYNVVITNGPLELGMDHEDAHKSVWNTVCAKVRKAWSYTSTPTYVFMVWCLVKHRGNLLYPLVNTNVATVRKFEVIISDKF